MGAFLLLSPLLLSLSADALSLDSDGDGLTDADEATLGTDLADADSDDDGLSDGLEVQLLGSSPLLCDSDGDALSDGLEAGVKLPADGTDPTTGCFAADADTETTDPTLIDTDGGTVSDGGEDLDRDGAVGAWETDPNDPADDVADSDSDGIPDAVEVRCTLGGSDADRDGDGVLDGDEGRVDSDGDGTPDFCEADDDGDGLPTAVEGTADSDGDGAPDWRDPDADNDGITDGVEGTADVDCDGVAEYQDPEPEDGPCADPDADGVLNGDEETCGSSPLLADTDGDGLSDADESCEEDNDCDLLPDRLDADTDAGLCGTIPLHDSGDTGVCIATYGVQDCGKHAGGACSSVPIESLGLGLVAAALLIRRRRRAALAVGVALAPLAHAQEYSVQRFAPVAGGPYFGVLDANVGADGLGGGFFLNYADDPLVYRYTDETIPELPLVHALTTGDLSLYYNISDVRIGFDLPFSQVGGEGVARGLYPGDFRLNLQGQFGGGRDQAFAFFGRLNLPTGASAAYVGDGALTARGGFAFTLGSEQKLSANLGIESGTGAEIDPNVLYGPHLFWGVAGSYPFSESVNGVAELAGETFFSGAQGAIEARLGVRAKTSRNVRLYLGGGAGLNQGIGAPDLRVLGGVAYVPVAERSQQPTPRKGQGQGGGAVQFMVTGQGGQPVDAWIQVVGTERRLSTGPDGVVDSQLRIGQVEVMIGAEGYRPIKRTVEVAPNRPNTVNVSLVRSNAAIVGNRIEIRQKVYFEVDSASIKGESHAILDDVAALLAAHPEIRLLEVQGHTDNTGTTEYNRQLSQARAEAVVQYLVKQGGIAPNRLRAVGYGETQPVQPNSTEAGRDANRRVVFQIVQR